MTDSKEREALQYVVDCWRAAEIEGLHEAIAEGMHGVDRASGNLADLLTRRIGHGIEHARAALAAPTQPAKATQARIDVLTLKPGDMLHTKNWGLVEFLRWDDYQGERTAEIRSIKHGDKNFQFINVLQAAHDDWLNAQGAQPYTGDARLSADHQGMRVDYSGLFRQARTALQREPGLAEMLRQLQDHITELGTRWYAGDMAVVDELLQLYCVEKDRRAALRASKGEGNG